MPPPVKKFERDAIPGAARIVRAGGLIVFPTDTVYGLGCDPLSEPAMARLFSAKKREPRPVPVLCASFEDANRITALAGKAADLARSHWPGALTIVAPTRMKVPRLLDQGSGTVGVRVPDHALCLELLRACGGLLAGTSANVSGSASSTTVAEALAQLGGQVDLYLDGGQTSGVESTVVRVAGDEIIVLRQGRVGVMDARKWE